MRSLVLTRHEPRLAAIADVLRREGFWVDFALPPLTYDQAIHYEAVFTDAADGEAAVSETLAMVRSIEPQLASPFVAMVGLPDAEDQAERLVKAGIQTCLPADAREFAKRMRFITNAIQMRARLIAATRGLHESEEKWRVAIDALDEGLLIQAKDGRVSLMNPAAGRILGMTEEQIKARTWHAAGWTAHGIDGHRLTAAEFPGTRAILENRPILGMVMGLTSPDGRTIWVSVSSHPIRDPYAGANTAVVSTLRDLTEQRRLEMHVMATERLASLGRLAASVGHEINNPLTYVLAGLDGVADRLRARGLNEDADIVDEALVGAERIRTIVQDLRVFSTRAPDRLSAVDVRRVLESCVRMAMAEIRPRGRLDALYRDVPYAKANEARLAQVVLNLLVNAAQAMREDGSAENVITLETGTEPDGRIAIVVRDTGVGISAEDLPRVTQPFFTTKGDAGGSGLGLSICQMLVDAQGGELRIESSAGGTRVTVLLRPATGEASGASVQQDPVAVPSKRHRVLVVDDEPQIARLIGDCLKGCEVTTATGGNEAIGILQTGKPFDAIVCDLMMPETSGVDVHAYVQRTRPALEPHMLFVTGGAYTPRALSFVAGMEARCIEKPFTPNALVCAVERAVEGYRPELAKDDGGG